MPPGHLRSHTFPVTGLENGDPAPDLLHNKSESQLGRQCQVPPLNS